MKKTTRWLTLASIIFTIAAVVMLALCSGINVFVTHTITNGGTIAADTKPITYFINDLCIPLWEALQGLFKGKYLDGRLEAFTGVHYILWIILAVFAAIVLMWLIQLVSMIAKKNFKMTDTNILWLIVGGFDALFLIPAFFPNFFNTVGSVHNGEFIFEKFADKGESVFLFNVLQGANFSNISGGKKVECIVPFILVAISFTTLVVAYGLSLAVVFSKKKELTKEEDLEQHLIYPELDEENEYVDDEDVVDENNEAANNVPNNMYQTPIATNPYAAAQQPLIVQNISYGDPDGQRLTAKEIKELIREELKRGNDDFEDFDTDTNEVLNGNDLASIVRGEINNDSVLSCDELRAIIHEELDKFAAVPEESLKNYCECNENTLEESVQDESQESITRSELKNIIHNELNGIEDDAEQIVDEDDDEITANDLKSMIREEITAKNQSVEEPQESEEEFEAISIEELRHIIADELNKNEEERKAKEEEEALKIEIEEESYEDKPLTSNELRMLIQEALEEHDNPDRRDLTEDEAHDLIVETIKSYYEDKEKAYKEELEKIESEKEPKEPQLRAEDIRDIIVNELDKRIDNNKEEAPIEVDVEEIKSIIAKEFDSFREEQKAVKDKEELDDTDVRMIELARAEAEAEQVRAQADEIEALKQDKLTKEDIRTIISEELQALLANYQPAAPVVEEEPVKEDNETEKELKRLQEQHEHYQSLISKYESERAELETLRQKEIEDKKAHDEAEKEEQRKAEEEKRKAEEEKRKAEEEKRKAEEERKKAEEEKLKAEEEKRKAEEERKKAEEERKKAEEERKKAEEEEEKESKVIVLNEKDDKLESVVAPKPEAPTVRATGKEVVPTPKKNAPKKRSNYAEKLLDANPDIQSAYNILKAELLSYGLKSRLSNSGDTFRLHTKTYCKITVAGKSLKLYFALDPKDYAHTPIPVKDASNIKTYKDIPCILKVRSDLSIDRAKMLIRDCCEGNDLEQGKVERDNYIAELHDYEPQI